jgi:hypothetical protein
MNWKSYVNLLKYLVLLSAWIAEQRQLLIFFDGGERVPSLENFVPATGIGKFDLDFSDKKNRLDVTINFCYDFTKEGSEVDWDLATEGKFRLAAKKQIEEFWSERYIITCAKKGRESLYADVFVNFNEVARDKAAYIVKVARLARPKSSGGIDHGSVPHVCGVNNYANELDESKKLDQLFNYTEGLIRGRLRDMGGQKTGDFLVFPANSAELSMEMRLTLAKFCTYVNSVRTDEFRGIKAFVIGFHGKKDSFFSHGLAAKRATAVEELLNAKVRHGDFAEVSDKGKPLSVIRDAVQVLKNRGANPSNSYGGVLLVIGTPTGTAREAQRKYVVMLHEFGHMLGLPDEYMGAHSEKTISKMTLDSVVPSTYIAAKAATGNERLKVMQEGLVGEIEKSGVTAPVFMSTTGTGNKEEQMEYTKRYDAYHKMRDVARKKAGKDTDAYEAWKAKNLEPTPPTDMTTISSSIMHSGGDILPAHYVTIWSGLCKMTAGDPYNLTPADWKIVPSGKGQSTLRYFK